MRARDHGSRAVSARAAPASACCLEFYPPERRALAFRHGSRRGVRRGDTWARGRGLAPSEPDDAGGSAKTKLFLALAIERSCA